MWKINQDYFWFTWKIQKKRLSANCAQKYYTFSASGRCTGHPRDPWSFEMMRSVTKTNQINTIYVVLLYYAQTAGKDVGTPWYLQRKKKNFSFYADKINSERVTHHGQQFLWKLFWPCEYLPLWPNHSKKVNVPIYIKLRAQFQCLCIEENNKHNF